MGKNSKNYLKFYISFRFRKFNVVTRKKYQNYAVPINTVKYQTMSRISKQNCQILNIYSKSIWK